MNAVRERDVERVFREEGERRGALVLKMSSPGTAGVPDRLVVRAPGVVEFAEIKRPGQRPRPLQLRVFARLARLGCPVHVIDSAQAARDWWAER